MEQARNLAPPPPPGHCPGMTWRIGLLIVLVAGLASWGGWWLREQWAIDACLDAGGRWEHSDGYCLGAIFGPREV